MKIDCHWLNSNLEAYFSEGLTDDDTRRAQEHLRECSACAQQVQSLHDIDPMIQQVFHYRLNRARMAAESNAGRVVRKPVLKLALAGTIGVLAAGIGLSVFLREAPPPPPATQQAQEAQSLPSKEVIEDKSKESGSIDRSKPDAAAPIFPLPQPGPEPPISTTGAPGFAVIDAAGYSTTLDSYRGHVLIFGVWSSDHPEAATSLQQLYAAFGTNPNVRILGIPTSRQDKFDGVTFPVAFNHGSRLMDVRSGEFMLIDSTGNPRSHGSLVTNTGTLLPRIKTQLAELGIR